MNIGTIKNGILFWCFTAVFGLYFIPIAIVAYLNPFWFRQLMFDWVHHHIDWATRYRARKFGERPTWL